MVHKNYELAAHWFNIAAKNGDPVAQYKLGNLYGWTHSNEETFKDVRPKNLKLASAFPKNLKEAAKWLTLSANQGFVDGQFLLGIAYRDGQGVTKSNVTAYKWFGLAAMREISDRRANGVIILRDHVAKQMTEEEMREALTLINEWEPIMGAKP